MGPPARVPRRSRRAPDPQLSPALHAPRALAGRFERLGAVGAQHRKVRQHRRLGPVEQIARGSVAVHDPHRRAHPHRARRALGLRPPLRRLRRGGVAPAGCPVDPHVWSPRWSPGARARCGCAPSSVAPQGKGGIDAPVPAMVSSRSIASPTAPASTASSIRSPLRAAVMALEDAERVLPLSPLWPVPALSSRLGAPVRAAPPVRQRSTRRAATGSGAHRAPSWSCRAPRAAGSRSGLRRRGGPRRTGPSTCGRPTTRRRPPSARSSRRRAGGGSTWWCLRGPLVRSRCTAVR